MMVGGMYSEFPVLWPCLRLLSPLSRAIDRLTNVFARLHTAGGKAVTNTKLALEHGSSGRPTIFSKAFSEGKIGVVLSDSVIADEASNFIIAGSDTTAVTLTYLIWAVLSDRDVKMRLLQELKETDSKSTTFDRLSKMPYLNSVIEETLRLYSAAPGSLPRVSSEDTILSQYRIPKGTVVCTQAWTIHRDPAIFPNPLKFDPSRWAKPTSEMQRAFVPWGGGSRSKVNDVPDLKTELTKTSLVCMGQHIARMELLYGAYTFFRDCPDASISTPAHLMETRDYFLIQPLGHECCISIP